MTPDSRLIYDDLRNRSWQALASGDLETALALSDEALDWASSHGTQVDRDRAQCNRAAVMIEMGRADEVIPTLRRLLLSSTDPLPRHLAAYNVSIFHDREEDFEKSRFYAEVALSHAKQTGSNKLVGRCHNRIANVCAADSDFPEAIRHYQDAEGFLDEASEVDRANVWANLGYCLLTQERFEEGFQRLFAVRRTYRKHGVRFDEMEGRLRLSLCYGYIEIERLGYAIRHGKAALAAGERTGNRDILKKALYLLGESYKQDGEEDEATACFSRLQAEHYPEHYRLVELLMNTSTHRLINLMA